MPIARVQLPDGRIARLQVPEGTSPDDVESFVASQFGSPKIFEEETVVSKPEEIETTVGGQVKEALKGLVPGAFGLGETAITGAAALLPEEQEQAVRRAVSSVVDPVREAFAPEAGYEETTGRKLGEAIGSTLPFFPLGALGAAGRIAATGLGVGAGAGEARLRAEEEGATEGERGLATALGAPVGALEALPPVRVLRRLGFGDEALQEVAGFVPALRRVATAGSEEALQEASSQVLQNLIAKGVYDPEAAALGGVGEAAALGGGAGAVISAIMELAIGRRSRGAAPAEEEPPVEEEPELLALPAPEKRLALPGPKKLLALPSPRIVGYEIDSQGNVVRGITEDEAKAKEAEFAELRAQSRFLPMEQMDLGLEGGIAQPDMFLEEPTEPGKGMYIPAEDLLSEFKPRSKLYREAARDLGIRLDKKGNIKPNQFVFAPPEAGVAPGQERFDFDYEAQQELPLTTQAGLEGQGDLFAEVPIPRGGPTPTVPTREEIQPAEERVPEEQEAFFFSSAPIDQLPPKQRVLRVMTESDTRKTVQNLRGRTGLPDAELKTTLAELRDEGVISYKPGKFEWELTPEGVESVRTDQRAKPARTGRGAPLPVSRPRPGKPGTTGTGPGGVAGVGGVPPQVDAGETEVEAPLEAAPLTAEQKKAREDLIRRAQQRYVARKAIEEVTNRKNTLNTRTIEAYENDQISEETYQDIREELKKPGPNFGTIEKVLSGEIKPGRKGIKFQRGKVGAGLPTEQVQTEANDAVRTWTNAPKIVVAQDVNDSVIPEDIRGQIPEDSRGFYRNGTVYILADRASDADTVRGTLSHEALGHYGLEQEFQDGLRDVMQDIYNTNPNMQRAAKARMAEDKSLDAATAVEEILASRSEAGPIKESWLRGAFNKAAAYVRNFLRKKGLVSTYSDNDVTQILRQAHRRVTEGKKAPYDPFNSTVRYQRSPEAQRRGDQSFINSVGKIPTSGEPPTRSNMEAARNAASNVTPQLRRSMFSFMTLHQLDQMYGKYIKTGLKRMWDSLNAEGVALRKREDELMETVEKGQKVMEKYSPAERTRIFNMMLDTTVEQVEVLDLVDKSRGIEWKAKKDHPLYKEFMALAKRDPAVLELYKDLRLAYLDYALGIEKVMQQYLTPTEWQKIQLEINKRRLPVYLPLFRTGDYKLTYTDKSGQYVSRLFGSPRERDMAAEEARRAGATDINPTVREDFSMERVPPTSFFGEVVGTLRKNKVPEDVVRQVFDTYMDYLPNNSVLQLSRKREATAGYEPDVLQALANVGSSYARRLTNMEFAPRIAEDQEQFKVELAEKVSDGSINADVAADLNGTVQKQLDYFRNPNLNNWASKLGYFSYTMYLGANISTAIVNVLDIPTVTLSKLGGTFGFVKSSAALTNAAKLFFAKQKPAEIQQVIDRGLDSGVVREQRLRDIAEFKNLDSKYARMKAGVDRVVNWAFAKSDMFNRETALIAAYQLSKAKRGKVAEGEFDEEAFNDAKRSVYDIYGSSFPKAGPPIMQNGLARTALTFKQFAINRMLLLTNAIREAGKGESKEVRDAARKELMGYFGTAYVFAGAQGMPLVGAGMTLVSALNGIFGDDDEPYDPEFALREAIGLFNYKGPVNYLTGVDIASRTGWTGMFWREDPKRMAEVGPVTYTMEQFLGPAYSYAVGVPRAFDYMENGQYGRAFEQVAPRAIGNIHKSIRYATDGAKTANGIPLVEDVGAYNQFMQLFGFRPSDVAEAGEEAGAAKRMEGKIFERRNGIIERAALAQLSGDADGFREAVLEAANFNQKNPGKPISLATLQRAIKRRQDKIVQSVNGVTVDRKLAMQIYGDLGIDPMQ